jgi:hypothetical protein
MPTLLELQLSFARALLKGDDNGLEALVAADGISGAERVDAYRNNVVSSLTDVLAETYPALRRLVDPRFFNYAAHEFLAAEPPRRPRLAEYGSRFPAFIEAFEPCRPYPYLADVARLEWLVHTAAEAPDAPTISPTTLQDVAPDDTPRLVLAFHPSFGYMESCWPIDRIWDANRDDDSESNEAAARTMDIDTGRVRLEVARAQRGVALRELDAPTFAFRNALWTGCTLEVATEVALAAEPAFDLAGSLVALFGASMIVGVGLAPSKPGETP